MKSEKSEKKMEASSDQEVGSRDDLQSYYFEVGGLKEERDMLSAGDD